MKRVANQQDSIDAVSVQNTISEEERQAQSPKHYSVICAKRYEGARRRYQAQFQRETRVMVALQPSALEGVRLERAFQRVTVHSEQSEPSPPRPKPSTQQQRRLASILEKPRVTWPQ